MELWYYDNEDFSDRLGQDMGDLREITNEPLVPNWDKFNENRKFKIPTTSTLEEAINTIKEYTAFNNGIPISLVYDYNYSKLSDTDFAPILFIDPIRFKNNKCG